MVIVSNWLGSWQAWPCIVMGPDALADLP